MANSQDIKNMLEEFLSDLKGELYDVRSDAMRDAMVHRASETTSKPANIKRDVDITGQSEAFFNKLVQIYNTEDPLKKIKGKNMGTVLGKLENYNNIPDEQIKKTVEGYIDRLSTAFDEGIKQAAPKLQKDYAGKFREIMSSVGGDVDPVYGIQRVMTEVNKTLRSYEKYMDKAYSPNLHTTHKGMDLSDAIMSTPKGSIYHRNNRGIMSIQNAIVDQINAQRSQTEKEYKEAMIDTTNRALSQYNTSASAMAKKAHGLYKTRGKNAGQIKTDNLGYYDFETVGTVGSRDFGITEMSVYNAATGKMMNSFFQLSQDASTAIAKTIKSIEDGENVSKDAMMHALRMADYTTEYINGTSQIVAKHTSTKPGSFIDTSTKTGKALIQKMKSGLDIMSGKTSGVSNLVRLPDKVNHWQGHAGSVQKIFSDMFGDNQFTLGSNNGMEFDDSILRQLAPNLNFESLDILDLVRSITPKGSYNPSTGKMLKRLNLSGIADWVGAQTGGAHTGANDVKVGSEAMIKYLNLPGIREKIRTMAEKVKPENIQEQIFMAKSGYTRASEFGHFLEAELNEDGSLKGRQLHKSTGTSDKFDWKDTPITKGSFWKVNGRFKDDVTGRMFTELENVLTKDIYREDQTDAQFQKMMNQITQGDFKSSRIDEADIVKKIPEALAEMAGTPYAWNMFEKILGVTTNKDGTKSLSASNKSALFGLNPDLFKNLQTVWKTISEEADANNFTDVDKSRVLNMALGSSQFNIRKVSGATSNPLRSLEALKSFLLDANAGGNINQDYLKSLGYDDIKSLIKSMDLSGVDNDIELSSMYSIANNLLTDKFKNEHTKDGIGNLSNIHQEVSDAIKIVAKHTANVKDGKSVLGKKIYDMASKDMRAGLTSEYLNTKYKNNKSTKKYEKSGVFNKNSPLGRLDHIAEMASKEGIGLLTNYDDATGIISLGVYDPTITNPETKQGYDWSQVSRIDMPTLRPDGTYQYRGMKHSNIGQTFLDENGNVAIRGVPEIAFDTLDDLFTPRDYKNGKTPISIAKSVMTSGGADKFVAYANAKVADDIDFTSAVGNTGIKNELASYERAGGSIEQTLFRNSLITDKRLFEDILSMSDEGSDIIKGGEHYKINPYLNALAKAFNLVSHGGDESLNAYRSLPEAKFITDDMAAKLKERAVKFGNDKGAVKEEAKLNYINGSNIDPHYYLPFGWAYAPGDRAPSQIENDRELTEEAKQKRREDLNPTNGSNIRAYRRHFRTKKAEEMIKQYRTPEGNTISADDYYNDPRMFMYRMYSDDSLAGEFALSDESFALRAGMNRRLDTENHKNKTMSREAFDWLMNSKKFKIKNWDKFKADTGSQREYTLSKNGESGYIVEDGIFGDSNEYSLFEKGDIIDSVTPMPDGTIRLNGRTIHLDSDEERKLEGTRGRGTQSGTFKTTDKNRAKFKKIDSQKAAILSGSIKANARNIGSLVDAKMEYIASLIDEHIAPQQQKAAYDQLASELSGALGSKYTVGRDTNNGYYLTEDTSGSNWKTQAEGLAKVATGFYGGNDWFAGLADKLGLTKQYDPNASNVWLRNTNQNTNSDVGERVKWGIKSEKSIQSVMQMAGMTEEERGQFLKQLYNSIGYGDEVQKNAEKDITNISNALQNTLMPSNLDKGNYLRIVSDSVFDTLSELEQRSAIKASDIKSDLTTISKGKRRAPKGLQTLQKKISEGGFDGAYVDMGPDYGVVNYRDGQYGQADNAMATRKIGLTGFGDKHLESFLTDGGSIPNWILEQAKLINSVADMDSNPYAVNQAVGQADAVIQTLTDTIGNKEGEVWDARYNRRLPHSAQLRAIEMSSDLFNTDAKFLANKGIVHQNVIKSMLGDLSEDELIAELKKAYKATGQTYNKKTTGNLSKSDLIKKIVKSTDFATYGSKAYSIQSMLSRVPFISRFGELFGGLITYGQGKGQDVSEGSIRLAPSLAGFEHGDFDGDTFRAVAATLGLDADDAYVQQFSNLASLTQEGVLWYEYLSGAMNPKTKATKVSNDEAEAKARKDIETIMDPQKAAVINTASKFNKEFVSTNSLLNTGLRNTVAKYYTGANPDDQHLFNGIMSELPSKILEQDPISAKKMIENVEGDQDGNKIIEQIEAFRKINEERSNISYARGNAGKRYNKFFDAMKNANLISEDGYFSGGPVVELLSNMLQGQFGKKFDGFFKSGSGKSNITTEGESAAREYFTDKLKSLGFKDDTVIKEYVDNMLQARVHENIIKKATGVVDREVMQGEDTGGQGIYSVGSWGRSKDYWSKTSSERALYGAARVLGVKPEKTEIYRSANQANFEESLKDINKGFTHKTSTIDGTVNALNTAAEAQNMETQAEQAKIPVAEAEAKAISNLDAAYQGLAVHSANVIKSDGIDSVAKAADNATASVERLDGALGLVEGGKSFGVKKGENFENDHQYQYMDTNGKWVDYKGNTSTGLAGRAQNPLDMQNTPMQMALDDFKNYKDGSSDAFNKHDLKTRSMVASTIRGNYVHKQMELLGNARKIIEDSKLSKDVKGKLMSTDNVESIIDYLTTTTWGPRVQTKVDNILSQFEEQGMTSETVKQVKTDYEKDLGLIFGGDEDVTRKSYVSTAEAMRKRFSRYLTDNGLNLFGTELSMGVGGDNPFVATLDTLSTDTEGNWVVGDWKTTAGKPNVKEYLQLQNNMKAVRSLLDDVRSLYDQTAGTDEEKTNAVMSELTSKKYGYTEEQARRLIKGRNKNVRGTLQHSFAHIDETGNVTNEGYGEYDATSIPERELDLILRGLSRGETLDDDLIEQIQKKGFHLTKSSNSRAVRKDMYDTFNYKMKGQDTLGVHNLMESFENDILNLGDKSAEFGQDASGLKNSIKAYFDTRERLEADDLLPEGQRMSKEERSELVRQKDTAYSAITEAREFRNANLDNKNANENAQALAKLYGEILSIFDQINTAAAKRTTSEQEYISLAQQDAKLQEQIAAAKATPGAHTQSYISELEQRLALIRQIRSDMVGSGAVGGGTATTIDEQIAGITLNADGNATDANNETSDAIKTKGDIAGRTESAKNAAGGLKAETQAEEAFYNLIEKEILLLEKRAQLLEAARLKKGSDLTTDEAAKVTSDIDQAISNLQRMRQALKDESAKNKDANAELEARENFVKQEEERLKKGKSKAESKGQAAAIVGYATTAESEREKARKEEENVQKRAIQSSLNSYKNYNTAELNMERAINAREKAYLSGNPQAIAAAEQQFEGARLQAQIASQHKAQFVAVDANGKIIQTTNENGRPISLEQLKKSGVDIDNMQGMARVWNAESGDWENVKLNAAQTKQYVTEISEQWSKHQQLVGKVHAPVKTLGSLVGEVLGGIKQTTAYLMRTSLVYGIIGKVKQAFSTLVQTVKALNKSYVDLRIASGQTDSQMKDTMKIYSQMASEMGKTTQEVAAAANDWLRAGYNAEESAKLIKNSMQLSTVGMIESAKATEYLISTMKGWKLGVDDMEGVIDKMSELDRNAAISAGDIAEAMSRANVSAQLAGSELNKYMSYITTVSDVSQMSAETVGTA